MVLELIARHRSRGILVDTNILVLAFVGAVEPQIITNRAFKRTEKFASEDYRTLEAVLRQFSRLVTTPNVLTETNNLLGQLAEPARSRVLAAFGRDLALMKERHVTGERLGREPIFVKFGLTDAGILVAARKGYLVLTDDFPLYNRLSTEGYDVINFNHLRLV